MPLPFCTLRCPRVSRVKNKNKDLLNSFLGFFPHTSVILFHFLHVQKSETSHTNVCYNVNFNLLRKSTDHCETDFRKHIKICT